MYSPEQNLTIAEALIASPPRVKMYPPLDALLAAFKLDNSYAFSEEYLDAAAHFYANNPVAWQQMRDTMQKSRSFGWSRFRKAVEAKNGVTTQELQRVSIEIAPNMEQLVLPNGYKPYHNCLTRVADDGAETIIAYAPVVINKKLQDIDTGDVSFEVMYARAGRWNHVVVDRAVAFNGRKLVDLAGKGFPVAEETAKRLAAYLHRFEAANPNLPVELVSSHLGWQGDGGKYGFLIGGRLINDAAGTEVQFRTSSAGADQIAKAYAPGGTLRGWLDAVAAVATFPLARIAIYASLAPVLLDPLGVANFLIDIAGPTSRGKTTLLRLAASLWGAPDGLISSWDVTRVYAERVGATASGLPMFLDDTKRARNPNLISDFIYLLANGVARGRGSKEGLDRTLRIRTVALSTGEAPLTTFSQDGGAHARVLSFRDLPFGATNDATRTLVSALNAAVGVHHGHAGCEFVEHVVRNRHKWPEWRDEHAKLTAEMAEGRPSGVMRLAQYAAAITIAAKVAHEAIDLPWEYEPPFTAELWDRVAKGAEDAAGAERALMDTMSWAWGHVQRFHGRAKDDLGNARVPVEWAGIWEPGARWTEICFFPTTIKQVLKEQGYQPNEILEQWKERGWIESSSREYQCRRKLPETSEKPWVVAISRNAVDALDVVTLVTVTNGVTSEDDIPF